MTEDQKAKMDLLREYAARDGVRLVTLLSWHRRVGEELGDCAAVFFDKVLPAQLRLADEQLSTLRARAEAMAAALDECVAALAPYSPDVLLKARRALEEWRKP